jgi:diguanylate cyclase (GGDEF)-like protein/PAS domain S-box-containing protein
MAQKASARQGKEHKSGEEVVPEKDRRQPKQKRAQSLESMLTTERYLNIAAEIIVALDVDGNIRHLNESGYRLLGYEGGLVGKNWFDTCLPEDEREDVRRFFGLLKNERTPELETRENFVVTRGGEKRAVLWHNTILSDPHGCFLGTLSSGEDITERIEMEKSLRIALAKYKILFECFPLGITIADKEGNIMETNSIAEKLLSVPREEHVKRDIDGKEWRIIRPDGTPMPAEEYASVRALQENRLVENAEMGIVKPDLSVTWISVNASPLEGYGVVVTYGDISERKRTENLLQARVRIGQFAETHTLHELLQKTLDEAETLTNSQIGFAHFLQKDQKTLELQTWSTNTLKNICTAEGKGQHYSVDQAGAWVECVFAGKPVIHNDYAGLPVSRRKGLPPGHAPIVRELVVPVVRSNLIVSIFGVGNKPADYTEQDVKTVQELANLNWDIIQSKRAEEALKDSERKYRMLHESMMDGFVRVGIDGQIIEHNHVYAEMLGYSEAELPALTHMDITPQKWHEFEHQIVQNQVLTQGYSQIYEKEYRRKDGSIFPVELRASLLCNEHLEPTGIWAIVRDISARKQAEETLRESEWRNRVVSELTTDYIFVADVEHSEVIKLKWASENMARITGQKLQDAATSDFWGKIIHPDDNGRFFGFINEIISTAKAGELECRAFHENDKERWIRVFAWPQAGEGDKVMTIIGAIDDITERKLAQEALENANAELKAALEREKQLSQTDMLTGVCNRRKLYELIGREFEIAVRYRQPLSVMMFDLDRFKEVNDTFGHLLGDQMLVCVTKAACAELRSADAIGRYGGEEFIILLPMTGARQAFSLAERIRKNVAKICLPTPVGDASVTLSIGIVEMKQGLEQDKSVDDLIRRADQAMYAAKQSGRNCAVISK